MITRILSVFILLSFLALMSSCSTASHSYAITPPAEFEQALKAIDAEYVYVIKGFNRGIELSQKKDITPYSPEFNEAKQLKAYMDSLPDPLVFISLSKLKITPLVQYNMDKMLKKTEEFTNDPAKGSLLKDFVFDYNSRVKNPIPGYPSRMIEADFTLRGEKKHSLQLYVYREGYLYMVNCGCKPTAFDTYKSTFNQVINSFKFLD